LDAEVGIEHKQVDLRSKTPIFIGLSTTIPPLFLTIVPPYFISHFVSHQFGVAKALKPILDHSRHDAPLVIQSQMLKARS